MHSKTVESPVGYFFSKPKRGRPKKQPQERDYGTPELKRKKLTLSGNISNVHLSSTVIDILTARGYLSLSERTVCDHFLKLTWRVRRFIHSPSLSRINPSAFLAPIGDIRKANRRYYFSQEETEEMAQKDMKLYHSILKSLDALPLLLRKRILETIQDNSPPLSLVKLLDFMDIVNPFPFEIRLLKKAIKIIDKEFKSLN